MTTWQNEARDWILHDGQKGMKWGRRRYRNYDGTLTPAGRERYGVGQPRKDNPVSNVARALSRKERKAQKEIKRKASARAAEKKAKAAEKEARKAQEELKKEKADMDARKAKEAEGHATPEANAQMKLDNDRLNMTNAQLKAAIDRLKLEREYKDLLHPPKQEKPVEKKPDIRERIINFARDTKELASTIDGLSETIKKIKKMRDGSAAREAAEAKRMADLEKQAKIEKWQFEKDLHDHQRRTWASDSGSTDKARANASESTDRARATTSETEDKKKKPGSALMLVP